ncbi:MAG TPA: hypothetical protein DIC51_04970 [Coxiellaceae bacterium]|nr:hypothetical protein [Coxiellaceae bacterium]
MRYLFVKNEKYKTASAAVKEAVEALEEHVWWNNFWEHTKRGGIITAGAISSVVAATGFFMNYSARVFNVLDIISFTLPQVQAGTLVVIPLIMGSAVTGLNHLQASHTFEINAILKMNKEISKYGVLFIAASERMELNSGINTNDSVVASPELSNAPHQSSLQRPPYRRASFSGVMASLASAAERGELPARNPLEEAISPSAVVVSAGMPEGSAVTAITAAASSSASQGLARVTTASSSRGAAHHDQPRRGGGSRSGAHLSALGRGR